MKRIVFTAFCILCSMLIVPTAFAQDTNLRATLGVNFATGWTVTLKINGTSIRSITGASAQAVQLFHKKHPDAKEFPKKWKELLCLTEGTNTIEITYSKVEAGKTFELEVYVRAIGYSKALLEATLDEKKEKGSIKGIFVLYAKEPKGFKTETLK